MRHRMRQGSTWVDHMQSEWHVTGTRVTWDFRGGGRMTSRGKSRGDGWDRYKHSHLHRPPPVIHWLHLVIIALPTCSSSSSTRIDFSSEDPTMGSHSVHLLEESGMARGQLMALVQCPEQTLTLPL